MDSKIKNAARAISQKGGIFMFMRAQFSSQISSLTDFGVSLVLVNVFGVFYGLATFLGAISGGIVNSIVNYKWTFKAQGVNKKYVAIKYLMVWSGSIFFNTFGTILMTELLKKVDLMNSLLGANLFIMAKIIVSLVVGFIWNYNMQRLFVYKDVNVRGFVKGIFKRERLDEAGVENSEDIGNQYKD